MIPFTESYQRGIASYLQGATGLQPTGYSDTPGAEFDTMMAENPFVQSRLITQDLAEQSDKAAELGFTLPSPVATQNWLDNRTGTDVVGQQAKDSLAAYDAQIADINQRKGTQFKTADQIFQARADAAKQQEAGASEVLSRASTGAQLFGGLIGGTAGLLTDPAQLLTLLTPAGIEAFGGKLVIQLLKVAGTQAVVQGGVTLMEQEKMRDFYKAEGLTDDQVDAKIWQTAEAAAAGGAIFAPTLSIAGVGVNKLWRALRYGSRAEREGAVDALGKVDLGIDGNSDVRNMREGLDAEGKNPLSASPTNSRLFANAIDEKGNAIREGENPLSSENGQATSQIPLDAHAPVTDVPLESELSRSAAREAEAAATGHEQTAIQSDIHVQALKDEQTFLTRELKNKDVSVDALERAGALDTFSANAVREIDSKLATPLNEATQAALQKNRDEFIKSGARNYRQVINNRITDLKNQIKDTKIAGKQARIDANEANAMVAKHLQDATDAEHAEQAPKPEQAVVEPINKSPMSDSEVAAHVDVANSLKELDDPLVQRIRAALQANDHIVDGQSTRAVLADLDEREKQLNEYITCVSGGGE